MDVSTRIGVVGLGQIGTAVAKLLAEKGVPVVVCSRRREPAVQLRAEHDRKVDRLVRRGRLDADAAEAQRELVRTTAELPTGCSMVIEAIAERVEDKRALLAELAAGSDASTVLATTTSEIPLGELTSDESVGRRLLGLHFIAPVRATSVVEVIPGPSTTAIALAEACELCVRVDRRPITLPRSVVNAVLMAYLAEGLALCVAGVPPHRVDLIANGAGFGLGPLASLDLIGLDVALAVIARRPAGVDPDARRIVQSLHDAGDLGRKRGRGLFVYDEDEPGLNPRFSALLPSRRSEPPDGAARLWARVMDELTLCVEGRIATPGQLDEIMMDVLGLDEGPLASRAATP